jgi:hypothetical protein
MGSSRVMRLGTSVLLSLVMTAGLASPAFGALPTDPAPGPSASPAVVANPGAATPTPTVNPRATAAPTPRHIATEPKASSTPDRCLYPASGPTVLRPGCPPQGTPSAKTSTPNASPAATTGGCTSQVGASQKANAGKVVPAATSGGGYYISGLVTGTGATPLSGIQVQAYSNAGYYTAATAPNGTYSVPVTAGSYTVWFRDPTGAYLSGYYSSGGFTIDSSAATPVPVTTSDVNGINVQLGTGHFIKGAVTGTGSAPLSGIQVQAYTSSYSGWTTTASDGTYSLDVPGGSFTVYFFDYTGAYLNGYYTSGGFTTDYTAATPVPVTTSDVNGISVQLGTGHFIKGTVTGTGGAPLSGIIVEAFTDSYSYYGQTTTASNGTYSVDVPAGSFTVYFYDQSNTYFSGYYSSSGFTLSQSSATPVPVTTADVSGISVQMQTGHYIRGTVTGTGGTLLSGILVQASNDTSGTSAWTASDGTYSVYVASGTYTVSFQDRTGAYLNGYYSSGGFTVDPSAATPVPVTTSDVAGINVRLGIGHYIRGTVTGTGGTPLSGIQVRAYNDTYSYSGSTTTAPNGTYSVDVPADSFTVEFYDSAGTYFDGYYSSGGFTLDYNAATKVPVTTSDVSGISVQMQTGFYIKGTVTGTGATPLAGVEVDASSCDYYNSSTTGSDGAYSVYVPAGSFTLYFHSPDAKYLDGYYGSGGFTIDYASATPVPVTTSDVSGINVQMQTGFYIKGTVTGTGATPLSGISVAGYSNSYYGDSTTTASNGTYALYLPAGNYTVSFNDYSGAYFNGYYSSSGFTINSSAATPVPVTTSDVAGINVQLGTGHHIKGTVTDTGGAPLSDIEVDANNNSYYGWTTTASNGAYSLAVPTGSFTVSFYDYSGVYLNGYYSSGGFTPYSGDATAVPMSSSDVTGINVEMSPGGATYYPVTPVRLLDTRSGNGHSGKLSANTPMTFQISGRNGIPSYATAVTGNVTVVNPTNSWAVYLGPDPVASPGSSTINFNAGDIKANGVTVALSASGSLSATYMSFNGNTTDLVFDVTGYFTRDTSGATYHEMSPARLLDTRYHNGLSAKLSANTPATFQITGRDGIPANATAVTGNVTVVGSTNSWAVYLGPVATASPGSSTINFNAGDIKANNLTVALGSGGTLSATYLSFAGNTTDLVFDVTGYYTWDSSGDVYVPIAPTRLLDTRSGNGLSGALSANTPATFQISGRNGIPSWTTAVTGNVTVVNETSSWAIFVGPDPAASPGTSTLNFNKGDIVANGLTVALGWGGTLSATFMSFNGNTTDLVFDVTGYFMPANF